MKRFISPKAALEPQSPCDNDPAEIIDLDAFRERCDEYNRLLPFARNDSSPSRRSAVRGYGTEVEKTVNEIKKFVADVQERMRASLDQLAGGVNEFKDSIYASDGWYENGDLLSLTLKSLRECLVPMESNAWDADRFVRYVHRIIPEAAKKEPPQDEEKGAVFGPTDSVPYLFTRKTFELIQLVRSHGRRREAFQLLVLLLSLIRNVNERVSIMELHNERLRLLKVIPAFWGGKEALANMPSITVDGSKIRRGNVPDSGLAEVGGLRWTYSSSDKLDSQYWDFSSAARTLRAAYMDKLCRPSPLQSRVNDPDFDGVPYSCFHIDTIEQLNTLQIQAWSETRVSVFLTIGTLFVTEITERIFECVLEVEGIPQDPETMEGSLVEPPRKKGKKGKKCRPGKHFLPRKCGRAKVAYKCCHIKDEEPRHTFQSYEYRETETEDAG